jgi:cytidylate kinase
MIDISPYSNGIAKVLEYQSFDMSKIKDLPSKTIIRISGLAGAGKGTISKLLCDKLNLVNLETSYILRTATFIYETLKLDYSEENTQKVYDQIEITLPGKALEFRWKGQLLSDKEIRSNIVQENVARYSGIPYFRELYYNKISYILNNLISSPVILDGRGFNTPYINQAKLDGFNVVCLFFWINDQSNFNRYQCAYLKRHSITSQTPKIEQEIKSEFKKNIQDRNYQDYLNAEENNLGAVIPESFVINTSELNPEQVLEVVLSKIFE